MTFSRTCAILLALACAWTGGARAQSWKAATGSRHPALVGVLTDFVAHRYWALVVSLLVILTTLRLFRLAAQSRRLMLFQYLLIAILVIQITLGGFTVLPHTAWAL